MHVAPTTGVIEAVVFGVAKAIYASPKGCGVVKVILYALVPAIDIASELFGTCPTFEAIVPFALINNPIYGLLSL